MQEICIKYRRRGTIPKLGKNDPKLNHQKSGLQRKCGIGNVQGRRAHYFFVDKVMYFSPFTFLDVLLETSCVLIYGYDLFICNNKIIISVRHQLFS